MTTQLTPISPHFSFVVSSLEERIDHALKAGALQDALGLATSGVQQQPSNWAMHHRLGLVLAAAGRVQEAFAAYTQALRLHPLSVEVRSALANAYLAMKDGWTACAWVSDACRVQPGNPALWLGLAQLLHTQKRDAEIEPALRSGLAANPQDPTLTETLAEYYLHRKRFAEAAQLYPQLFALNPKNAKSHLHLGFSLEHTHQLERAVHHYREALAINPQFVEAHVDLAGVLWRLADFSGALVHAQQAVALDANNPFAVRILGTAHLHLNQLEDAEKHLRRALELRPDFPIAIIDLALLLLLAGRFEEGWAVYERRWYDTDRMTRPAFFKSELEWKGPALQPVAGKRIVIYAEQGLGDVIQFVRYAKLLQQSGAIVYCVVQPELIALVESMPGVVCIKPGITAQADYHVALLELPLHYRSNQDNAPADVPYLAAPAEKVTAWKERIAPFAGKLKVGITWAGHHIHANHYNRCMPLSEFAPILSMPGVQAFSLQKTDGGTFSDITLPDGQLIDWTTELEDFTDTAALVENLDLVIGIDSAVIHLAGALGKPTWVPLPSNPDWRWLLERDNTPWYPTMRLFRRTQTEARSAQMQRVAAELEAKKVALKA